MSLAFALVAPCAASGVLVRVFLSDPGAARVLLVGNVFELLIRVGPWVVFICSGGGVWNLEVSFDHTTKIRK